MSPTTQVSDSLAAVDVQWVPGKQVNIKKE